MDISLSGVVKLIVFLLVAAGVFGLLFFLVEYIGKQFPGEGSAMFVKFAKIALVVMGILIIITILLSFVGAVPAIRFTP